MYTRKLLPIEALESIKLRMNYDASRTLTENLVRSNKNLISENFPNDVITSGDGKQISDYPSCVRVYNKMPKQGTDGNWSISIDGDFYTKDFKVIKSDGTSDSYYCTVNDNTGRPQILWGQNPNPQGEEKLQGEGTVFSCLFKRKFDGGLVYGNPFMMSSDGKTVTGGYNWVFNQDGTVQLDSGMKGTWSCKGDSDYEVVTKKGNSSSLWDTKKKAWVPGTGTQAKSAGATDTTPTSTDNNTMDTESIQKFQDWLDSTKGKWAWSKKYQRNYKVEGKKERGYGKFGPNTTKFWNNSDIRKEYQQFLDGQSATPTSTITPKSNSIPSTTEPNIGAGTQQPTTVNVGGKQVPTTAPVTPIPKVDTSKGFQEFMNRQPMGTTATSAQTPSAQPKRVVADKNTEF